jgi:hypothetical protein
MKTKSRKSDFDDLDRVLEFFATQMVTMPVIAEMLRRAGVARSPATVALDAEAGLFKIAKLCGYYRATTLAEAQRYVAEYVANEEKNRKRPPTTATRFFERMSNREVDTAA